MRTETEPKTLGEILTRNAVRFPARAALLHEGRRRTWAELDERANRLANGLRAMGLNRGDRAAFLLPNGFHWIEVTFATLKAGAVVVPLNHRMAPRELQRILDDCSPSVLVLHEDFLKAAQDLPFCSTQPKRVLLAGEQPGLFPTYENRVRDAEARDPGADVRGEDLAYISFTTGTTGFPKGVMWRHNGLLSTVAHNPFPAGICGKSRQMVLAPSFVAGSQIQILNAAYHGATMILMDFNPSQVLKAIENERPTLLASAAVMLRMLAAVPGAAEYDTSSLRRIYYGGSSMGSPEAFRAIKEVFPCEYQQGYGSAETSILVSRLDPDDHEGLADTKKAERLLSAGRPAPGVELKIVRSDGKGEVPQGEVGEVAVRSPWLMEGYWNRPGETKEVFTHRGYYLTGDMAWRDEDGYIFLVDRKDDMIKTGGLNVYPSEVEAVLSSHPSVLEAAAIGLPHPKWNKAVTAVVRLTDDASLTETELRDYCRQRIGSYKVPKTLFFSSTPLPRNPLGKVERKTLRETYSAVAREGRASDERPRASVPDPKTDPLKHCRKCEFQDVCEKFCYKYFESSK